ncbi:MAG: acyltransferase [Beijerinckiaceae bacterium]|nr:acyltransferase [Beijerinckiaceae bacterium]
MRSSTGVHYLALDHLRALAAFMVFTWHFLHAGHGYPIPFDGAPRVFPLALLDEGHTGVALFMTLSGYLFAKLLDGASVRYGWFIYNRLLRLLPILIVTMLLYVLMIYGQGGDLKAVWRDIRRGWLYPTLPNGGWSITVEFHFYLVLPFLLLVDRFRPALLFALIALFIAIRLYLYTRYGEIQTLAYWTIIGRIDQFTLGILAYRYRALLSRGSLTLIAGLMFGAFYWWFDWRGGFYNLPSYPSPSRLWVVLPMIEGLAYGILIAWYDARLIDGRSVVSRFFGQLGAYSYSIYLLHFFVVFHAAQFIDQSVMRLSNFYVACAWSLIVFCLMIVPGYLSFRFIESPFLKLRKRYIARPDPA